MLYNLKWFLDLQTFADGAAGEGGEGGAESGVEADPGRQRLLELGVPADKIRKNVAYKAPKAAPAPEQTEESQQAAPATAPEEPAKAKPTWEEILKDPDYNDAMQRTVKGRLKSAKDAEANLTALAPLLELTAKKYGMDINNLDYKALAEKANSDPTWYEDEALSSDDDIDTVMKRDQETRQQARESRQLKLENEQKDRTIQEIKFQNHVAKLERQGEELRKTFPDFDLWKEMENPVFKRLTAPDMLMSVEDAYYAVHRQEIMEAQRQATAQRTAQQISASIQAGQGRPKENGTSSQSSSVTTFDYRHASREQRNDLKRRIQEASMRGEKLYPGQ